METQIKLSPNFTLNELIQSSTANKYGISNTPDSQSLTNLTKLCKEVLQPIRDKYGKAIVISSGYRSPKVNKLVGGVSTSQHVKGEAADIHSKSDTEKDNMVLWKLICDMVKSGEIKVGQYIFEYGHKNIGPSWIHLSQDTPKFHNQKLYIGCK